MERAPVVVGTYHDFFVGVHCLVFYGTFSECSHLGNACLQLAFNVALVVFSVLFSKPQSTLAD